MIYVNLPTRRSMHIATTTAAVPAVAGAHCRLINSDCARGAVPQTAHFPFLRSCPTQTSVRHKARALRCGRRSCTRWRPTWRRCGVERSGCYRIRTTPECCSTQHIYTTSRCRTDHIHTSSSGMLHHHTSDVLCLHSILLPSTLHLAQMVRPALAEGKCLQPVLGPFHHHATHVDRVSLCVGEKRAHAILH